MKANRDEARRLFSLAAAQGLSDAKRALEGVDFSVPERSGTRDAVFVCVVANEDYSVAGVDKVPHAVNDGKVFAEISFYGFLQKRLESRFPPETFSLPVKKGLGAHP